ncbi:uncharacterized protein PG986_000097 [Apiospora aurea]|uniref:Uncharacterized protein n=1 Tax=Apiospora aurea TaxID=335848 RepID=A0ABR1QUN1_9PEZI
MALFDYAALARKQLLLTALLFFRASICRGGIINARCQRTRTFHAVQIQGGDLCLPMFLAP